MLSIAINICILPPKEIKELCSKIYKQDKSEYSDEDLEYIPHITLLQKSIDKNDLEKLMEDIKTLKIEKFEIETKEFLFSMLLWLWIKRNEKITNLQKKIIEIWEKYSNLKPSKNSFITQKHFSQESIDWVENYLKYLNFDKDLHITLWQENQLEEIKNIKLPKSFIFDSLCIGQMWNYCSVRKILYKI